MPEGHVIHRLAHQLNRVFGAKQVAATSPQGRFADSARLIDGTTMVAAEAFGKQLYLEFDAPIADNMLSIHLGLIGKLRIGRGNQFNNVDQIRLQLAVRGWVAQLTAPQTCRLVTPSERDAAVAKLGADPLRADADPNLAWQRIHRSQRSIADLLMDTKITPGVGNIYRAEVLFRNRVAPDTPGARLRPATWQAIWDDLCALMDYGVDTGRIDTVRDEHLPEAQNRPARQDPHGGEVYVYRRANQACLVCGAKIRSRVLAGRNLFWCGRCQRRR